VGLDELPCVVRETSDAETMELALIENLQRKDLTPFEEADGLKTLAESYGYTHQAMAEKLGKSRTSVTEIFSLTSMPEEVRQMCRLADIHSKSLLLQVVRQGDSEKMFAFVRKLQEQGTPTRQDAREIAKKARAGKSARAGRGRPRNYVFKFQPREKTFRLALEFRKSDVPRDEIVRALQSIIEELSRD
jgi:ParB family chromosome partitioning protein